MIVILKPHAEEKRVQALMEQIRGQGVEIHFSQGTTDSWPCRRYAPCR